MNIHEYQAKELLRRYGVPVPDGFRRLDTRRSRGSGGQACQARSTS